MLDNGAYYNHTVSQEVIVQFTDWSRHDCTPVTIDSLTLPLQMIHSLHRCGF